MNLRKVVDEIVSKNFGVLVHHLFKQKKIYCLNNDLEYKIKNNVYIRTVIDKIIKKTRKSVGKSRFVIDKSTSMCYN